MREQLNIQYSDFRSQIMTIEELLYHIQKKGIHNALSQYSRTSRAQQSRLIEAILLNIPQMPFFIDDTRQGWIVIEGTEHIKAIYSFCNNKLPLTSTYFRTGMYEGKTFSSLSLFEKSKILNTKVEIYAINPGLSGQERFGIYMCFKSRNDATAASWCRSRIYPEKYAGIVRLARKINSQLRGYTGSSDAMENRICHLLLGIHYKSYLDNGDIHHIDHAINSFFEASDFMEMLENHSEEIARTLWTYDNRFSSGTRLQLITDSVTFHLRRMCHDIPSQTQLTDRCRQILSADKENITNAESFCRTIDTILKSYFYAYSDNP